MYLNWDANLLVMWFVSDLIHCTNEPNVSIPQLANLLIERSQNANWIVVFKALITVHHMMCYGNEVNNWATEVSGSCTLSVYSQETVMREGV